MKLSVGGSHAEVEIRLGDVPTEVMFDAKKNTSYRLEKTTDSRAGKPGVSYFLKATLNNLYKDLGGGDAIGFFTRGTLVHRILGTEPH